MHEAEGASQAGKAVPHDIEAIHYEASLREEGLDIIFAGAIGQVAHE